MEEGPLAGTSDAKYFLYDVHGRREWEIGPLEGNGARLARMLCSPPDERLSSSIMS